eukprot:1190910-Prorocentrum_minimum.AAC.5
MKSYCAYCRRDGSPGCCVHPCRYWHRRTQPRVHSSPRRQFPSRTCVNDVSPCGRVATGALCWECETLDQS